MPDLDKELKKELEIPNFGKLLAPHLGAVPMEAYPYLLSELERTAAERYRGWAQAVPEHARGILACAEREDEIADIAAALVPVSDEHRTLVAGIMPAAKKTYYSAFEGLTAIEQMTIQANAERQGAGAWQGLKAAYPKHVDTLDKLSAIELRSADYLDELLATIKP